MDSRGWLVTEGDLSGARSGVRIQAVRRADMLITGFRMRHIESRHKVTRERSRAAAKRAFPGKTFVSRSSRWYNCRRFQPSSELEALEP